MCALISWAEEDVMGNQLFDVAGKVALVTGGAQGMGRMIAHALVAAGARVYITSRNAEGAEQAAAELRELHQGECYGVGADLSTPEAAVALATELKSREPRLDILVNNAGKTWGAPLESFPDEAWASVMAVNVQGPFTLVRELLPLLDSAASAESPARVIIIGSVAGLKVEPLPAYSYVASKAAVHHLSRALATDLASHNITVNAIVPGYFPTKMTAHIRKQDEEAAALAKRIPLGRLGTPEDIGGLCLFLASRAGAYVTGALLPLDGGLSGCN